MGKRYDYARVNISIPLPEETANQLKVLAEGLKGADVANNMADIIALVADTDLKGFCTKVTDLKKSEKYQAFVSEGISNQMMSLKAQIASLEKKEEQLQVMQDGL